jgi:hypothetical protein
MLISSTFYERLFADIFCAKKLQSQNVTREKLHKALLYKKTHEQNDDDEIEFRPLDLPGLFTFYLTYPFL